MAELDGFIEHLADQLMARGVGTAAVFFLEACKPLSLVGQQFLIFCHPAVKILFSQVDVPSFIQLLEDRHNVERLICALEARLEAS